MNPKQLAALLGFLFVAAWIAFNFGYAVLCLVGAAVFYGVAAVAQGEVDLGDLQSQLGGGKRDPVAPNPRRTGRVR